MIDNFQYLPLYASFLLQEKLSVIEQLYQQRALSIDPSLLQQADAYEGEQQELDFTASYVELLQCLAAGKGKEHIIESIGLWKNNQFPSFSRDMAGVTRLITLINIRKYTFIKLLIDYSSELEIREQIILELVDYYS